MIVNKVKEKKKDEERFYKKVFIQMPRLFVKQLKEISFKCFIWSVFYVLIQVVLVIAQVYTYRGNNGFKLVARSCGILIEFNFVLIILMVLDRGKTLLRGTKFGRKYLPIDEFICFHKFLGVYIMVLSVVHTMAQMMNLLLKYRAQYLPENLNDTHVTYTDYLFTTKSDLGWFFAAAMPTGWACLGLMMFIYVFTLPCIRRRYYELFRYTHVLNVFVFILLVLHSQNCWKWLIAPTVLFLLELCSRCFLRKSKNYGNTYIKDVNLLASNVTHLVIKRPNGFNFKPGDYVRIKVPIISKNQYHAFTISSAPELKNELWLHIRSCGNWTRSLYEHFHDFSKYGHYRPIVERRRKSFTKQEEEDDTVSGTSSRRPSVYTIKYTQDTSHFQSVIDMEQQQQNFKVDFKSVISQELKDVNVKIRLDGPLGTASRDVFYTDHAVLIAGGIGVTPFTSILQSIWMRHLKYLVEGDSIESGKLKRLKKVHFIWVNSDHRSFEWFFEIISQIIQVQTKMDKKFIEIMLYASRCKTKEEIQSKKFELTCASSDEAKERLELLINEMHAGRPNLEKIFSEISKEANGKVEVTFCGPKPFGKDVKDKCKEFNFKYSQESFG